MHLPPRSALEAVYEIVMATTHQAEPALSELGLTMSTAYALWAIDPDEPAPTMKVLAQRLRCNASSLTFISDRLVERGYINRTEDPANRRFRVLSFTPTGLAARQAMLDALNQACPLMRLSDDKREDLLDLLGQTLMEPDEAQRQPVRAASKRRSPSGPVPLPGDGRPQISASPEPARAIPTRQPGVSPSSPSSPS